jgi:DNA-binding response OmpR family regulator
MKVLVVSQDPQRRAWIWKALGPSWEMIEASNGLEAIRIAEGEDVDLVVTDETTDPFGAFGLARELKALEDPPAVVILLERSQDAWLARWSGADRWLLEPVAPFALADAAAEVTAAARAARSVEA